ncbi:MAG: hypothetical protein ABSF71_36635 [Terriglobia bacterium]|jgi:hypothetical protein
MKDRNRTPYVVKREADRWVFVPTSVFASLMIAAFGAGSAFLFYLSTFFLRRADTASANLWIGAILLFVASLSAGLGIHAWRTRRTPLNIEFGGRVSYGERELCAAGTVRAVRIAPSRGGEANDCEVCLELAGQRLASVPSPYFGGCKSREQAHPSAAELAEALGVQVRESR